MSRWAYPVDEVSSNNKRVTGDDEEEAWLDALESGDVNERGYLPAKKTATLTVRQVSVYNTVVTAPPLCCFNFIKPGSQYS